MGVESTTVGREVPSPDSPHSQNRKRKRKHKHKNKRPKHDGTDEKSRLLFHNVSNSKAHLNATVPDFQGAANAKALPPEGLYTEKIVPEDEEIKKSSYLDRNHNIHDNGSHISRKNGDDHYVKTVSDDGDTEWQERESIAEIEMIKELERLDRGVDALEEEILWAIMKSDTRTT
ncbi:hypothetical protein V1509DRAFT_325065 [Lipomyces kononenkoae]